MSDKIKIIELVSIEYVPVEIDSIPGISDLALDYTSSIGGATKPEEGADVTADNVAAGITGQGNLATLNQVDTAQIVANAVTKAKMALLSVDADIIAASAITENKLYTGAVTADKISSNAVTSAKINAGAVIAGKIAANAVTATEINVSTLSAISANCGTLTSGTITGLTIQTSGSANTGVKMSSDLGGLVVYGQTLSVRSTGGSLIGSLGNTYSGFAIITGSGLDILFDSGGSVISYDNFLPAETNVVNIGSSSKRWGNIYTSNVDFASGVYINYSGGYIQSNGQFRVVGSISLTGNLVFENAASITINGRAYYQTTGAYDASKYYLRS